MSRISRKAVSACLTIAALHAGVQVMAQAPATNAEPAPPAPSPNATPPPTKVTEGQHLALNGDYTYRGPNQVVTRWTIASTCDSWGTCSGQVLSHEKNYSVPIQRIMGGPWIITRPNVADAWRCDDTDESIVADIHHWIDPVTLSGKLWITLPAGTCGLVEPQHIEDPITLTAIA